MRLLLGCALGLLGCGGPLSPNVRTVADAKSQIGSPCELSLRFSAADVESGSVCIKLANGPVAIPSAIPLYFQDCNHHGYCVDDPRDAGQGVQACTWNRHFRDTYPIDFQITAHSGAVRDYLRMVDVFRNGQLAYRWDGAVAQDTPLAISGKLLQASGVPNKADFDLRLYPTGVEIPDSVLALEVAKSQNAMAQRFYGVARAGLAASGLPANLKTDYEALLCSVKEVRDYSAKLGDAPPPNALPGTPQTCPAVTLQPPAESLLARYRAAKSKGAAELSKLKNELEGQIQGALGDKLRSITEQATKLKQDVLAGAAAKDAQATAMDVDALVEAAVRTGDDALRLVADLNREAQSVLKDTAKQAEIYTAVAREAKEQGDPFDPYRDNPGLTGREVPLPMSYVDTGQNYLFAVWNGAAFRTNDFKTSPGVSYAIPILDVVGRRWKWDRSRFLEFRLAAGVMMFEDKKLKDEEAAEDEETVMRLGVHGNIAFGPYRLGGAFVPAATGKSDLPVRILIGADLYKLIFGQDLQAKEF